MRKDISRRSFMRKVIIGLGVVLTLSIVVSPLFAKSSKKVDFDIDKGKGGCSTCENEIKKMLKDKKMLAKLEAMFPEKTKVFFYVRNQKKHKLPEGINIAVGSCAKALKNDADLYISGCRKSINKDSIFKAMVKKFGKGVKAN